MADKIWGEIQGVFDSKTIEIMVLREDPGNATEYGPYEKVKIVRSSVPGLEEERTPAILRDLLVDRMLCCTILGQNEVEPEEPGQDKGRILIADVACA